MTDDIDTLRRQLERAYSDCAAMRLALDAATSNGTEVLLLADDLLEARRLLETLYPSTCLEEKQARGRIIEAALARRKADVTYTKMRNSPIEYYLDIQQAAVTLRETMEEENAAIDALISIREGR